VDRHVTVALPPDLRLQDALNRVARILKRIDDALCRRDTDKSGQEPIGILAQADGANA
jgi:hypothetical protein